MPSERVWGRALPVEAGLKAAIQCWRVYTNSLPSDAVDKIWSRDYSKLSSVFDMRFGPWERYFEMKSGRYSAK